MRWPGRRYLLKAASLIPIRPWRAMTQPWGPISLEMWREAGRKPHGFDVVHAIAPQAGGSVGAYALVGMGAVFAGAARAPITAVVILFELTGEYTIILPLMLAIVLATGVSHLISPDTVYTRKLLRRGIDIDEPADATLRRQPVTGFMVNPPGGVSMGADLREVAGRFAVTGCERPEITLVPFAFPACTANEYELPVVRPVTTTDRVVLLTRSR